MAKKRRKSRNSGDNGGGGGESSWMMTFSDLSTLLLTFFVLLISMSSLNDQALRTAFHNFDRMSGILFFRNREAVQLPQDLAIRDIIKSLKSVYVIDVRDINEKAPDSLSDKEFNLLVSTGNLLWYKREKLYGSFSFIFGDEILFESGSATLKPKAYPLLDKLAKFLKESNYMVFIDGHTDNVKPKPTSPYPTNMDLSIARAMAVLNYFIDKAKVPPTKLAIGGYGDLLPIADNSTPKGRALNRRVELIFKPIS